MELLFKEQGFQGNFKRTVGIVDADLSWERMKPSLEISTDEIVDLIGESNYNIISTDPVPPEKTRLLELVKYVVAFRAYMLYAPTGDLAMTNKGRTMRRDEFEVSAFEWQIEQHDNSLQSFYFRRMNLLLKYMVKEGLTINLDKFNHSDLIVPTLQEFEKHYGLHDSYFLYLNLLPGIREFEELELYPRIGKDLYENRDDLKQNKILYNYCQKAAVYYSIEWGLRHLDIQMFPKSVVRASETSGKTKLLPAELALVFEKDSKRFLEKIETEISSEKGEIIDEEFQLPDLDFNDNDLFVST